MMIINPGVILVISALLTALLSAFAWKHRTTLSGKAFSLLMAAASVWAFFYGLELFTDHPQTMWFSLLASYLGIAFVPVLWLFFVARYTGVDQWLNRRTTILLLAVPVITLLAVATNPLHFLFYNSVSQQSTHLFSYLVLIPGPFWYLSVVVSHGYFFVGLTLLVYQYFRIDQQFKPLLLLFMLAGIAPYVFNVLYILEFRPFGFLDITPLAFLIMGALLAFGAIRYHLFEITPLAHDLLFNHLSDPVFVFDNQNRLVHQNPYGLELLHTLPGKSDGSSDTGSSTANGSDKLLPEPGEQPLITINEQFYYKQSRVISDKKGTRLGFLVQLYDVTESKKAEQILRENEKRLHKANDTKNLLFSIIAHDLKSPFASIMGFCELLIEDLEQQQYQEADEFARLIMRSSKKTVTLLEHLTDWARAQSENLAFAPETIQLEPVFRDVSELFSEAAKHKSIHVEHQTNGSLTVLADRNMLTFILRNLLDNAIKFSNPESTVVMGTEKHQTEIVLFVKDQGIGIPAELQQPIFEIGRRRSREGTLGESGSGFGLLTCMEFVRRHQGRIWVDSQVGAGSTFFVSLPQTHTKSQDSESKTTGTSK